MKAELRQQLLRCRKELGNELRSKKSRKITSSLKALFSFRDLKTVFLYVPFRDEVDIMPFARFLWNQRDCTVCFPRCVPGQVGRMEFWQVDCEKGFVPGAYGILEPDIKQSMKISVQPDAVILPGVGFDRQGFRLGYGGGYYDQFLAGMPEVFCLGVAFSCQVVASLPRDKWDRRVRYVVTEKEVVTGADLP